MKPQSMTNREWFIKKIAVNNNTPEKAVHAIINHQFQAVQQAMLTNDIIEVCGFGKFLFNRKKAEKKLEKQNKIRIICLEILLNPKTTQLKKKMRKELLKIMIN